MLDSKGGFIVGLDPLSVSTQRDFVKVYNVDRYRIKIIDNIAPEGLALLNNRYSLIGMRTIRMVLLYGVQWWIWRSFHS